MRSPSPDWGEIGWDSLYRKGRYKDRSLGYSDAYVFESVLEQAAIQSDDFIPNVPHDSHGLLGSIDS